ncbi:hypothetical protein KSP39_PZI020610 [Platanthera zijinensis]|uniref:Uncharacterized protein n=1 Tax=Platanthera zijinensis TaxID=2320716 RepID=A0AAP0AZU6_9ASPA
MSVQCGLYLQYGGKRMRILLEESIEDALQVVTNQIAGKGKSYSDTPLTLMFHKHGVQTFQLAGLRECAGRLTAEASDVITKADKWPETFDTVHGLFESHHVHSGIDRPNVGITALAQGLMWVLAAKCFPIILVMVNEKLNALVSADSSAKSVTIVIKELEGVKAIQKLMCMLEREVEFLKKWNAALFAGTQEDTYLNPYGKIFQKEVHALDTACARLSLALAASHSAFVDVMNNLKSSNGGDDTFGVGEG